MIMVALIVALALIGIGVGVLLVIQSFVVGQMQDELAAFKADHANCSARRPERHWPVVNKRDP